LFGAVAAALLIGLAVISYVADWELVGQGGWIWFAVCVPEALLIAGLVLSGRVAGDRRSHRMLLPPPPCRRAAARCSGPE
jgi:hypothetical protein